MELPSEQLNPQRHTWPRFGEITFQLAGPKLLASYRVNQPCEIPLGQFLLLDFLITHKDLLPRFTFQPGSTTPISPSCFIARYENVRGESYGVVMAPSDTDGASAFYVHRDPPIATWNEHKKRLQDSIYLRETIAALIAYAETTF